MAVRLFLSTVVRIPLQSSARAVVMPAVTWAAKEDEIGGRKPLERCVGEVC